MQFDREAPVIIVRVLLVGSTGEAEIEMALDTGATYTIVPWDIAEQLGYDPRAPGETVDLTTVSSMERAPVITLEAVEVLGVRAERVKTICHDLPSGARVAGLLGLSFLKETNLYVRFKEGLLELIDP